MNERLSFIAKIKKENIETKVEAFWSSTFKRPKNLKIKLDLETCKIIRIIFSVEKLLHKCEQLAQ